MGRPLEVPAGKGAAAARLLQRAAASCFFTGRVDLAQRICAANMAFGLAKIMAVQQALGYAPDASFVAAPDATVTRNIERWEAGFGYGGRIRYSGDFVTLSIKPNACGIFLGSAEALPAPESLLPVIEGLRGRPMVLEGIPVSWDFGKSNHFISALELDVPVAGRRFAVVVHGSGPELRKAGPWGPGLYLEESPALAALATTAATPWGPLHVLTGGDAAGYRRGYETVERLSCERREAIAQALFPGVQPLSNTTHQGAAAANDYQLGCVVGSGERLVPVVLRTDLPVALVRVRPNLSDEAIERLRFGPRARRLGLLSALRSADILPHGGGYTLRGYARVARVFEDGAGGRIFELAQKGGGRAYHRNFRQAPFGYRGEEVVQRLEELGLGEVVARGRPVYQFMV